MFNFQLSKELVSKIVQNLREANRPDVDADQLSDDEVEALRTEWGRVIVMAIGTRAQQVRYEPAESFVLLQDGRFPAHMDDSIGGRIFIPEGAAGDVLMRDVGNEFTEWMRQNADALNLSPRAPITKFVVEDQCVTVYVRPKDPPIVDPNFVLSEEVE